LWDFSKLKLLGILVGKEAEPIKSPTVTEPGIPFTHQLMDYTNKEIPGLLQHCDLHVFIHPKSTTI
jgi:hypothetical protein